MARAGTLDFSGVATGVSAEEIVALALANVGETWTGSPAGFVWGISNLAGLPFFDLRDFTDGPANAFTNPDHWDEGFKDGSPALKYESPHQWDSNTTGDGWATVWKDTYLARASDIAAVLRPGDIVRVYDYGNYVEHSEPECGDINSHSLIVVSVAGGKIEVVDTWGDGKVVKHDWSDIVAEMTRDGKFQSAYVSRIDDDFVKDHVPNTLQGNAYGDWSGIGADLAIDAAPVVTAGSSPDSFSFTYRVDNGGTLVAAASTSGIYLSTDSTITTADVLLTTDTVGAILAGGFSVETGTFKLPAGLAAGTYYVGVISDYAGAVGEIDESNNASPGVALLTVGVDLTVAAAPALTLQDDGTGRHFDFSYRVNNTGSSVAAASKTGIYLSTDSKITTSDQLLTVDGMGEIAAGGFGNGSGTITLPAGLAAGTYYIGAIADYTNAIGELDESNNASPGRRIVVGSDLDVHGAPVLSASWAAAGADFKLTYRMDNLGLTAAPGSKSGIYLSTDSTITTADRLVAIDDLGGILAGASRNGGGTFTLAGNIKAGNYYIGVIADHDNGLVERNEANNASSAVRITIVTNGPDAITAPTGEKAWHGLGGNDTLTGSNARDALYGDGGNDTLIGRNGNDTLIGGAGHDILTGGAGADYFQFDRAGEIGRAAGSRDVIKDWDATADYIDLRNIDANSSTSANDAFAFVEATGSGFSGAKGELRWIQQNPAGTANDRTLVMGDVNGDKVADFTIEISGLHTMRAVDFLL